MRTTFTLLTLLLLVTLSSCDNTKKIKYQFAESPKILACDFPNGDLYNEAIHSFENDIINTYDIQYKSGAKAYSSFINVSMRGSLKVEDIASAHSLNIAHRLKEEHDLWSSKGGKTALNYSHPLVDCMVNNMTTTSLKQTINALLSTNSMRPNLVLAPLSSSARTMQGDGSLKGYVAFDFFYSQLLDSKIEDLRNPNPQPFEEANTNQPVDFNQTPKPTAPADAATAKDPHAGHNH